MSDDLFAIQLDSEIANVESFMARLVHRTIRDADRNVTIIFHDEPRRFSISVRLKNDKYISGTGESIRDAMIAFIEAAEGLFT
jgi:hypothetical protein